MNDRSGMRTLAEARSSDNPMSARGSVATSAVDRRVRSSRARAGAFRGRVRGAHLVVVFAGALGALLTLSALRAADKTVAVVTVARDVAPGAHIAATDLAAAEVHATGELMKTFFNSASQNSLIGQIAVNGLRHGDLVRRSDVQAVAAADRARAVSFSVPSGDAVNGALHVGDRVDVIGVKRDGSSAEYVVANTQVVAMDSGRSSGPLRSASTNVTVTVAVDAKGALRLVAAQASGRIVVVNATGADPLVIADVSES